MRTPATRFEDLILAKDLEYGDVSELLQLLEEVGELLEAYSQAIQEAE
jgi:hypothetical protein